MNEATAELARQLEFCRSGRDPFDRFNSVVLRRGSYYAAQRRISRAMADPAVRIVAVKSGHMTGKSYFEAGAALAWLNLYAESGVVMLGPSLEQVRRASWKEVRRARAGSPLLSAVGRLTRSPMGLEYGEGWQVVAASGTEPERLQGFHPTGPVLAIVDEASGVNDPDTYQALASLKPRKLLLVSNPLKDHGVFHATCQRTDDPAVAVITIPSTDSPDIGLEESPRGLADAAWLRAMAADYGTESQAYRVRVGAQFPEGSADLLIPGNWLDACPGAERYRAGPVRMANDLGLGRGGDDTCQIVRDDAGIIEWSASKFRTLEAAARTVAEKAERYGIEPRHISWDAAGIGADFDSRLRNQRIIGARPYVGARASADRKYDKARTACHFAMRRRLDPARPDPATGRPQRPFFIPGDFLLRLRREVRELSFEANSRGENVLRSAEEVAAALHHSPDYSVTLAQSFAFS